MTSTSNATKKYTKLYELPPDQNIKLYMEDHDGKIIVVTFGHIDGLYSYCWLEEEGKRRIVHIYVLQPLEPYLDGYKLVGESDG